MEPNDRIKIISGPSAKSKQLRRFSSLIETVNFMMGEKGGMFVSYHKSQFKYSREG